MDENGEILLLHASNNNMHPLILPCALYTLDHNSLNAADVCKFFL